MRPVAVAHCLHSLARQVQTGLPLGEGLEICPPAGIAPNDVFQHLPRGVDSVTEVGEDADFERMDVPRHTKKGLGEAQEQLVVEGLNLRLQALVLTLSLATLCYWTALVGHRDFSCLRVDDARLLLPRDLTRLSAERKPSGRGRKRPGFCADFERCRSEAA